MRNIRFNIRAPHSLKWLGLLFTAAFVSCAEGYLDEEGYTASLTAQYLTTDATSSYSLKAEGESVSFSVRSINVPWKASSAANWLKLSPNSGNDGESTVIMTAESNTNADEVRTSVVTLGSTGSYTYQYQGSATQAAPSPILSVSKSNVDFPAGGGQQTITVSTNATLSCTSNKEWLSASLSGNQLVVTAVSNPDVAERKGTITLQTTKSSSQRSATISVTQQPAGGTVTETSIVDVPNAGATYTVGITADADWTATSSQSWIEVSPSSGNKGSSQMAIAVLPNTSIPSRTGYVYVKIGTVQIAKITISQVGLSLSVSPEKLDYTADGGSQTIIVTSNTTWKVKSKPEWVTLSATQGNGNANLTATVASHNSTSTKSGDIVIEVEGTTLSGKVSVSQQARTFDNLVSELQFDAAASSQTFDVTTDGAWTASVKDAATATWVHLSTASGTGNATITVSVDENRGEEERSAIIVVTVGSTQQQVSVTQKSHYFTITPSALTSSIPSTGGTHKVSITSDDSWTASTEATWLTLSQTSGTGNIDVTLTAGDNASINSRSEYAVFTPSSRQPVRLLVTQAARYLRLDCTSLQFFSKGGESQTVTITTDATYSFQSSVDWLSVRTDGNTFTVVATENNGDDARTGTISVIMTGLNNGEQYQVDIPVHQLGKSANISAMGYGEDVNWNLSGDTHCTLTITHFTTDADWNQAGDTSLKIVTVGSFSEDKNWNP